VGDPILASNLTRRIDFALFMVHALTNDELIHQAPAIVGRQAPSARKYAEEKKSHIETKRMYNDSEQSNSSN
jgi:hypothetical protein